MEKKTTLTSWSTVVGWVAAGRPSFLRPSGMGWCWGEPGDPRGYGGTVVCGGGLGLFKRDRGGGGRPGCFPVKKGRLRVGGGGGVGGGAS